MKSAPGLASAIMRFVHLVAPEGLLALGVFDFLAHRRPHVGVDRVDVADRGLRIGELGQPGALLRHLGRLIDDLVRQLESLRRRDVHGDAEHHGRVHERRADVVAVADERDAPAVERAPPFDERLHVGQRLARMLLVAERVDDVQLRRDLGDLSSRSWPNVRITTASIQRSRLRATSLIGSRSACITSAGISTMSPPSSRTPIVKVTRVRSDGFSNSRPTCLPFSACAVGAFMPLTRSRFNLAATRAASQSDRDQIEDRRKFCIHHRELMQRRISRSCIRNRL